MAIYREILKFTVARIPDLVQDPGRAVSQCAPVPVATHSERYSYG